MRTSRLITDLTLIACKRMNWPIITKTRSYTRQEVGSKELLLITDRQLAKKPTGNRQTPTHRRRPTDTNRPTEMNIAFQRTRACLPAPTTNRSTSCAAIPLTTIPPTLRPKSGDAPSNPPKPPPPLPPVTPMGRRNLGEPLERYLSCSTVTMTRFSCDVSIPLSTLLG